MSNKNETSTSITEEVKNQNSKYNLSKFEHDLYHEEDDIAEKVIRVKSVSMPNKGQKWKIFDNNKIIFIIESTKISKKEREFLQTLEGFNFIINSTKAGFNSFNKFKGELKKKLSKSARKTK